MLHPAGFLLWDPGTTNVFFLLVGFSLGICRVLGFCPGVTGFYILGWWAGEETHVLLDEKCKMVKWD